MGVDLSPLTSPNFAPSGPSGDPQIIWSLQVELRVQSSAQIIYFYVKIYLVFLILQQYEVQSKKVRNSEMGGDENWDLISRFFEIEKILRSRDFWWSICSISEFLGILPSAESSRGPRDCARAINLKISGRNKRYLEYFEIKVGKPSENGN